jgi:tetratricopeptide (TPR) repeat protein
MNSIHALLPSLLTALIASCTSKDPRAITDAGLRSLNAGDYSEAAESFEQALALLQSGDQDWLRAKMGYVQALIRIDAPRAKDEFLELAGGDNGVTDREFNLIGSRLADVGHLNEATEVARSGIEAFPESEPLRVLVQDLGRQAESSGDAGVLDSLKGLGYVGGD